MTSIVIFSCCTLGGFCVGLFVDKRLKEQCVFVADLHRYALQLNANVLSLRQRLDQFDRTFASQCSASFSSFLLTQTHLPLNKSDGAVVREFFDGLACNSCQQLSEHLRFYLQLFADMSARYAEQSKKQKGLYAKLGILVGAMTGLLFV